VTPTEDYRNGTEMKFRRQTDIAPVTTVLLLVAGAAWSDEFTKAENNGCSAVKLAWGAHGLGSHMVPSSPLPGLYCTCFSSSRYRSSSEM